MRILHTISIDHEFSDGVLPKTLVPHYSNEEFRSLVQRILPIQPMKSLGFQRGWVRNPDGSLGRNWILMQCGLNCRYGVDCNRCPAVWNSFELYWRTGVKKYVKAFKDQVLVPFRWRKESNVYVCPEGDLFHSLQASPDEFIYQVFAVAVTLSQWHRFIFATKRSSRAERLMTDSKFPERVREAGQALLGDRYRHPEQFGDNIVMAVSAGLPKYLNRTKFLADIPDAMTKALFIAPMLGPFHNLFQYVAPKHIGWVMCAGERASQFIPPRPCRDEWHVLLRDQVKAYDIPFFCLHRYSKKFIELMGGRRYWEYAKILKVKSLG